MLSEGLRINYSEKVVILKVELSHCGMSQERFLKWYEATRTGSEETQWNTISHLKFCAYAV